MSVIVRAIVVFVLYLLLTAGSGGVLGLWAVPELLVGLVVSVFTGVVSGLHQTDRVRGYVFNPLRWLLGILYVLGPFFLELAKANVEIALRVITGKISPGIIRVKSGMQDDRSILFLANSITLTPGTLTVDIDEDTNDLFVHKINLAEGDEKKEVWEAKELFDMDCPAMIRRFSE
jgi:multicomponent Na+:H+ antiporter subunit E